MEPNDALDKMAYAYANPCAADLVDAVEDWPGVTTLDATLSGTEIKATRPKHFFRDDGSMPDSVTLTIHRPRGFQGLSQNEWAALVQERVRAKESQERQRRVLQGISVLGRQAILAQSPFDSPKSHAPHFQMSPKVAAKSKWARIEALLRNRAFQQKYRDAICRYLAGAVEVLFPFGTYLMRRLGRVTCETRDAGCPLVPAPA